MNIPLEFLDAVELHVIPGEMSAIFRNLYVNGHRTQYLISAPNVKLDVSHIPQDWRSDIEILHYAPLIGEILPEAVLHTSSLLLLTPQGWLRKVADDLVVKPSELDYAEHVLEKADIVVVSDEDIKDVNLLDRYIQITTARHHGVFVVTCGSKGATVHAEGDVRHFPTRPANKVVDVTGAGDVFAAAYACEYIQSNDPWKAAWYANAVASFSIEANGIKGIPSIEQVDLYLNGAV
jgi:sugar/nucleoside kinase (ribokinase family)